MHGLDQIRKTLVLGSWFPFMRLSPAILLFQLLSVSGFEAGDRISTQIRSKHNDVLTTWLDVPIEKMPRFKLSDSQVIQVAIPTKEGENGGTLNPTDHFKISMTFANHKLLVPWVALYDAQERKSLNKLTVIFEYDEYDVLRVRSIPHCEFVAHSPLSVLNLMHFF